MVKTRPFAAGRYWGAVFRTKHLMPVLLLVACAAGGPSAVGASMRCRIAQQAWSPCRMHAGLPGQRWVLTWDQQRVEFVHDGSGQMLMRLGDGTEWLAVEPFWTADHSLCWGKVCAAGSIPLD